MLSYAFDWQYLLQCQHALYLDYHYELMQIFIHSRGSEWLYTHTRLYIVGERFYYIIDGISWDGSITS